MKRTCLIFDFYIVKNILKLIIEDIFEDFII